MKTLKRFGKVAILASLLASNAAMADWDFDVAGQISAVDNANKTITLASPSGQLVIKVLPYTKIKGDDCGPMAMDIYGSFKDLTVGKFVEVEAIPNNAPTSNSLQDMQLSAKEIEWKCYPRAY